MAWVYYKGKWKTAADCSVCAVMKALDFDWGTAYAALCEAGRQLRRMPNETQSIDRVLSNGWKFSWYGVNCRAGEVKPTVAELAARYPDRTMVASTNEHVVAIVDGDWYDKWDSGDRKAAGWWTKPEED